MELNSEGMPKINIIVDTIEIVVWRKSCNTGGEPALYEIVGYPNNTEVSEDFAMQMQKCGIATIRRAIDGTDFG